MKRREPTPLRGSRRASLLALMVLASAAVVLLLGCAPQAGSEPDDSKPASSAEPVEVRVSAATSLKDLLEEAAPLFEGEHDAKLVFNFGPSGQLQKQIEGGAPADAFLSASPKQVDGLVVGDFVSAESTVTFAGNDIVIFVAKGNPKGITGPADLARAERLVTGNPDTAPHGTKSKEWLEGLGTWVALEPKFVFAENAAQTVDYVARGEVDVGLGFESEVLGSEAVEIAYLVPAGQYSPIRYVAAPLSGAEQPELAAAFVEFLLTEELQAALVEAGFNEAPAK